MQIYKLYLNVQIKVLTVDPGAVQPGDIRILLVPQKVKLVKFGRGELDLLGGNKKTPGFPGANEQNQQYLF
jgi:hypothetical protein